MSATGTSWTSAEEQTALGAKRLDYFWTVLAVDPVAFPVVRLLARRRWLSPDQVTWISMALGLLVGLCFGLLANRAGLILGAVLFYVSFVLDCVDGKLARLTKEFSGKGELLDKVADGARRASASLGLTVYLWRTDGGWFWWAVVYGIATFYFMEISGHERIDDTPRGRLATALARRRLLARPGMPDVSALVFVLGPLTGLVVPALVTGLVMVVLATLRVWGRLAR